MKKSVQKNRVMFFGEAIAGVIAIFIFSIICTAPLRANAYAIGSTTGSGGANNSATGNYDVGASFQQLISPFTKFMSDLDFSSNTTINVHGEAPTFPTVNLTPIVANGTQNILTQWGTEFDNWFYGLTGVHLSGIFFVILNAIAWTLGLAQKAVEWLLSLFH